MNYEVSYNITMQLYTPNYIVSAYQILFFYRKSKPVETSKMEVFCEKS